MVQANGSAGKSEADLAREQMAAPPTYPDLDKMSVADAQVRLKELRLKNELIEQEVRYAGARRVRKLRESTDQWDYLNTYQDLIDRLRQPDGILLTPISTANDRLYGANWPFWRTWSDHAKLRGISRIICTLSQQASGALAGLEAYVIGEGTKVSVEPRRGIDAKKTKPVLDACQKIIDDCWERNGMQFLETELFLRSRRDGEYFERYFPHDDGYLDIRTVEPEHIVESPVMDELHQADNGYTLEEYSFGIHTPRADIEHPKGFWVSYVGSPAKGSGEYVPIENMQHCKIGVDRRIKRGLPDFVFDTYDNLKNAGRSIEAMVEQAGIQASIAIIRQHKTAVPSQIQGFQAATASYQKPDPFTGNQVNVQRIRPGTVFDIGQGFEFVNPGWGTSIQYWIQAIQLALRNVGVKWNAPEWLLSGDASSNSYANAMVSESPFVKRCLKMQGLHSHCRVQTAWKALKTWAEKRGGIEAGGTKYPWEQIKRLINIKGELPSPAVREATDEAQENQIYVGMGIKSKQRITREKGWDYEEEQQNIDEDMDRNIVRDQVLMPPSGEGKDKPANGSGGAASQRQPAPASASQRQPIREDIAAPVHLDDNDLALWALCKGIAPLTRPATLPALIGLVGEHPVYLVDGPAMKKMPRRLPSRRGYNEADHMDFVDAGNTFEDPDLYELVHGKSKPPEAAEEIYLDAFCHASEWKFDLFHEAIELPLMQSGMEYDPAHEIANPKEKLARELPE